MLKTITTAALILCTCSAAIGQYAAEGGFSFAGLPKRTLDNRATASLDADTSGTLVVTITVDRTGKVVSADVNKTVTTFKDGPLLEQALSVAREHQFNAAPTAPEAQRGSVEWYFARVELGVNQVQEAVIMEDVRVEVMEMPPPPPIGENPVYDLVALTEQPQFPGGPEAMNAYLGKHLKYPPDAVDAGVQGRVYLELTVYEDGSIKDVKLMRGMQASLDKEALRVVKAMPKWAPGKLNGKAVRSRVIIPVQFTLR